jgi:hypothetical protein
VPSGGSQLSLSLKERLSYDGASLLVILILCVFEAGSEIAIRGSDVTKTASLP